MAVRLTKKDVAVIALGRLGGAAAVIDTEDAAITAHSIDQAAFGWKKYPERVDLETARTTLRHEGEANDPRIEGSIQNGWHLTPRGVEWLESNAAKLEGVSISVAPTAAAAQRRRAETREAGAAVNRVLTSDAYKRWSQGQGFTPRQAAAVFRIDEYTLEKDRTRKAAQLQDLVRGEAAIEEFIKAAIPLALELRAPASRNQEGNQ